MMKIEVIRYDDSSFEKPVAVVGLPSMGLVGPILVSFIARELEMKVLAGMTSPDIPPYCLVQGGVPYPPIRMYGCARRNATPACGDLIAVTSEIVPKPEQCYEFTVAVMDALRDRGTSMIVCLEGVPSMDGEDAMVACGSSEAMREMIGGLGIRLLSDGLVRGISGVMLYEGARMGMDVISIMCPTSPSLPDPRAAARILEPLSKIIPELAIDADPLYKEAEDIDARMRSQEEYDARSTDLQKLYG
ncbi:MAG: PAC2 family protein [Candidatus Methanoplasma sp.]|nr:PAC2 family protein [Candidatus Methanoplasma sp.]